MRASRWLLGAMFLVWIGACQGQGTLATSVVGYNHTDRDVGHFTVDSGINSSGGGFLMAHHGGGKFACCISIPKPWSPGTKVTVGWTDDHDENYQERIVEVPRYDADKTGQMSVHFLRNGEIKVFVTLGGLGGPDYPLKGSEAGLYPGEDPVEVRMHGRKEDRR